MIFCFSIIYHLSSLWLYPVSCVFFIMITFIIKELATASSSVWAHSPYPQFCSYRIYGPCFCAVDSLLLLSWASSAIHLWVFSSSRQCVHLHRLRCHAISFFFFPFIFIIFNPSYLPILLTEILILRVDRLACPYYEIWRFLRWILHAGVRIGDGFNLYFDIILSLLLFPQ